MAFVEIMIKPRTKHATVCGVGQRDFPKPSWDGEVFVAGYPPEMTDRARELLGDDAMHAAMAGVAAAMDSADDKHREGRVETAVNKLSAVVEKFMQEG